jgi:hypothetical protein
MSANDLDCSGAIVKKSCAMGVDRLNRLAIIRLPVAERMWKKQTADAAKAVRIALESREIFHVL